MYGNIFVRLLNRDQPIDKCRKIMRVGNTEIDISVSFSFTSSCFSFSVSIFHLDLSIIIPSSEKLEMISLICGGSLHG